MMLKARTRYALGAIIFILILALIPVHTLEVKEARKGEWLLWARVKPGDTFSLKYIHSVERIPVTGYFAVDGQYWIVVKETAFSSYGAGLPILKKTDDYIITGKEFRQRNINMRMKELTFFVHSFTEPILTFKGTEVPLSKRVREGGLIRIQVTKTSLLRYILISLPIIKILNPKFEALN